MPCHRSQILYTVVGRCSIVGVAGFQFDLINRDRKGKVGIHLDPNSIVIDNLNFAFLQNLSNAIKPPLALSFSLLCEI